MSIHLKIKKQHADVEKEAVLHSMPCKIYADAPAKVSNYFKPYIRKDGDKHFDASFRGHPLHGKLITVPEGYKGLVFREYDRPANPDHDRELFTTASFSKFTYWNYDKLPSKNDAIITAFDWIEIAEALHKPEEEAD